LTDLAIVRELTHPQTFQWDVRISYAEVGRRLDLDEETVRARVKKLQESGVIAGWSVFLNPRVLGRAMVRVGLALADEAAKDRVLPALRAMDGVQLIFDHYGPSLGVVFMQEPGRALERQLEVLAALTGSTPHVSPVTFPPATTELSKQDWRIVRALRADARRSYAELAGELGLSERTLRRSIDRLTQGKAVYLMPRIDMTRVDGLVPASFLVVHRDPAQRGPVDAYLKGLPGIMFQWYEGPVSRISLARRNVAEIEAVRRALASMPGVARVEAEITLRSIQVHEWLDEIVARKAEGKA
jgi:DNA-binding Lrp family transcriptional regulator